MTSVPSWLNARPSRGTAFVIHLALSLLIFSTLVAMMLVYWFPGDLFLMDGGWEGLKLVAMVDLVLGPALTLILFKPGKPGLKMDLSIIAGIQIAALAYGFYTTHNQRTVAVVFAEHEFATVSANDKKQADLTLTGLEIIPTSIPASKAFDIPLIYSPAAENVPEYLVGMLNGYPGAHERSDIYQSLDTRHNEAMQEHRLTTEELEEQGALAKLERAVNKLQRSMDEIEIYEFRARYADGYALFDPEQLRIIDYVGIKNMDAQLGSEKTVSHEVAENAE